MLTFIVPLFGTKEDMTSTGTYDSCARRHAANYFNSNPLHALRSRYFYMHNPPVDYCRHGKEHHMRINEALGQFFADEEAEKEDYDKGVSISDMQSALRQGSHKVKTLFSGGLRASFHSGTSSVETPNADSEKDEKSPRGRPSGKPSVNAATAFSAGTTA